MKLASVISNATTLQVRESGKPLTLHIHTGYDLLYCDEENAEQAHLALNNAVERRLSARQQGEMEREVFPFQNEGLEEDYYINFTMLVVWDSSASQNYPESRVLTFSASGNNARDVVKRGIPLNRPIVVAAFTRAFNHLSQNTVELLVDYYFNNIIGPRRKTTPTPTTQLH